jgi:ribulose-5-phosphate 4-epimerase/fuculose-1-phosphate aldolase
LLANHGPIATGVDLADAANAAEEIEQTARLWLLVSGRSIRPVPASDVAALAPKAGRGSLGTHLMEVRGEQRGSNG